MAEHLERAASDRSRCKSCKQPIERGSLRVGISSDARGFDGTMTVWYHALCDVLQRPAGFLRASAASPEIPAPVRAPLEAMANTLRVRKLVAVLWRHPFEPRCMLELADDHYALFSSSRGQPLVVRGALDEVVASVPNEDMASVVEALTAAGKKL